MDPRVFTWRFLPQLPKVPDHFIQRMLELAVPSEDPTKESLLASGIVTMEYRNRDIIVKGKKQKSRGQERIWVGEEWENWVRENIIPEFSETSARLSIGADDLTVHGAHIDGQLYRLFYLVSAGGDNVETAYYKAPDVPTLYALHKPSVIGYNNMDELIEIDRTSFPEGQWILHNGYILHSIEGITGRRVNINVTIKPGQERLVRGYTE